MKYCYTYILNISRAPTSCAIGVGEVEQGGLHVPLHLFPAAAAELVYQVRDTIQMISYFNAQIGAIIWSISLGSLLAYNTDPPHGCTKKASFSLIFFSSPPFKSFSLSVFISSAGQAFFK